MKLGSPKAFERSEQRDVRVAAQAEDPLDAPVDQELRDVVGYGRPHGITPRRRNRSVEVLASDSFRIPDYGVRVAGT